MSQAHSPADVVPALSMQPINFAQDDPGIGGWQPLFNHAEGADAAGIDRLAVSDHVVLGENLDEYADPKKGGIIGGQQPTDSEGHWLDPIVLLSMFAARTNNIRLSTGILIAGLRRPATLAKALATLDTLSEGRLDVGVGVGWQHQEYDANGVSYKGRGALLDETLDICQTLWTKTSANYQSNAVQFEKVHLNPKPVHPGGVPIWVSGRLNPKVLQRITRFGAGWIPWGDDAQNPVEGLKKIREELAKVGRNADGFQCTSHIRVAKQDNGKPDYNATFEPVGQMCEGGITDFRITVALPNEKAAIEDYLSPFVEAFRKVTGRT